MAIKSCCVTCFSNLLKEVKHGSTKTKMQKSSSCQVGITAQYVCKNFSSSSATSQCFATRKGLQTKIFYSKLSSKNCYDKNLVNWSSCAGKIVFIVLFYASDLELYSTVKTMLCTIHFWSFLHKYHKDIKTSVVAEFQPPHWAIEWFIFNAFPYALLCRPRNNFLVVCSSTCMLIYLAIRPTCLLFFNLIIRPTISSNRIRKFKANDLTSYN